MNKSAAGFCKRLHQSLTELYGEQKADDVCGKGVGAAASSEQKGQWAAETMKRLDTALDEPSRAVALASCACGPSPAHLESFRKTWLKCASLQEYCERRNAEMKGAARFETRDGLVYLSYPECYCSMVKDAQSPVSKTWCLCSCEYTRRAFSAAFGCPVDVTLLKSVLGGDGECLFEVRITGSLSS